MAIYLQFKPTTDKCIGISPEESRAVDLAYAIQIPVTAHSRIIAKASSLSFSALNIAVYGRNNGSQTVLRLMRF